MTARRALAVAVAALLCGIGDIVLALTGEHVPNPAVLAVFGPVVGGSFVGTGLYAWRRAPESRFGMLMVLTGFAWFMTGLVAANSPLVFTFGIVLSGLWGPLFGHMLLSFPTGRLPTRGRRAVVAASYVLVPLAPLLALLVNDAEAVITDCEDGCPRNVLLITRNDDLGAAALVLGSAITLGLCLIAVVMLVRQWRAAAAPERRSLVPLFAGGGLTLALVAVFGVSQLDPVLWVAFVAFAATPFAFLAGLARADVAGSRGVRRLIGELGAMPEGTDLRDALARALGDPELELVFWTSDRYVDRSGSPAELPTADDVRRTVTEIDHHGERIAAIVHDRAQDTEIVRAAGSAAALLLENRRLEAELRARLVELRASRSRLVEAADDERRRLERNLHDGAQARLVALALNFRLARMRAADGSDIAILLDASIGELAESLKELRDLARGIHPAVLSEHGLEPAVRALAARAPIPVEVVGHADRRLPAAVETAAYFVVSEALTNVSKYARAAHATVHLERIDGQLLVEVADDGVGGASVGGGSGLRGLSDRVAALSGTLEVSSPPGQGTRLRARMPCT